MKVIQFKARRRTQDLASQYSLSWLWLLLLFCTRALQLPLLVGGGWFRC
jgi:hypothetical protein